MYEVYDKEADILIRDYFFLKERIGKFSPRSYACMCLDLCLQQATLFTGQSLADPRVLQARACVSQKHSAACPGTLQTGKKT